MSKNSFIPIFYHPTNVLLIDDDRKLLNNVSGKIDPIFPYVLKQKPHEALHYLRTHVYDIPSLSKIFSIQDYETAVDGESIRYHFPALREEASEPDFYKKIVVVFVDQMMEGMTGLEFAAEVQNLQLPVQVALLTGKAGTDEAVEAFNEGIINAYIPKNDPEMNKKINAILKKLALRQFEIISEKLLGSSLSQSFILPDQNFQKVFHETCEKNNICSFYLVDMSCSYLLLDTNSKAKYFMVRSASDFETIYELAKDSHAPQDVLQSLRDKQAYPFTRYNNLYPMLKGDAWADAMIAVEKIPGREIFYTTLDILLPEDFSFNRYMNEIWPTP